MPFPFYYVRARLHAPLSNRLEDWEALTQATPDMDENGEHIGQSVLRNLRRDGAIGSPALRAFFIDLLDDHPRAGLWADPQDARLAYRECCHRPQYQRQGPPSTGRQLWHVIKEDDLRRALNIANGVKDPYSASVEWVTFVDAYDRKDWVTVWDLLAGASIHPDGYQVFAFHPLVPGTHTWADPSKWSDSQIACAALGLSLLWSGYSKGDRVWLLKYNLDATVSTHVPTSIDADWNSHFYPSPSRSVPHGSTVLLGPLWGAAATGMPEVVHRAVLMRYVNPPVIAPPGEAIIDQVRRLAPHTGW